MAILNINPTRMNLLLLRKKLSSAKRGHKLLKDKRDGLMKHFMQIVKETRDLRIEIDEKIRTIKLNFIKAGSSTYSKYLEGALLFPDTRSKLIVETEKIMSVPVPKFKGELEGDLITYGLVNTPGDLDLGLKQLKEVYPQLIELAGKEKTIENLASEIEKTRRRVNMLEYIMIPNYNDTLKYIQMKLSEQERGTIITNLVLKSMMEKEEN
jgi:V/A-type H+-transporting ATPase subunit D